MDALLTYYHRLRRAHLYLIGISALLVVGLVLTSLGDALDRWLYDRIVARTAPPPSSSIVIVAIDDASLQELGGWPWPRAALASVVESLSALGARDIFLDLLLNQPDLKSPEDDRLLANAMVEHGRVYLPVHVDYLEPSGQPLELLPAPRFAEAARALGHVSLEPCPDGVIRNVWLYAGARQAWWPHVTLAMTEKTPTDPELLAGAARTVRVQGGQKDPAHRVRRQIPWAGSAGSYLRVSALDLLAGRVPERLIRGNDVLVGVTAPLAGDRFRTPTSARMAGVEVNANILQAVQEERLFRRAQTGLSLTLNLFMGLLVPVLLPWLKPRRGVLLGVVVVLLVPGVQWLGLVAARVWIPLGPVMVTAALAGVLWNWRRIHDERRFLRTSLERATEPTPLRKRMSSPGRFSALFRMLDRVLPVEAWRLETVPGYAVQTGGRAVSERAWQSARACHYAFAREGKAYELTVLWRDENVPRHLDRWVECMAERMEEPHPTGKWRHLRRPGFHALAELNNRAAQETPGETLQGTLDAMTTGIVLCDACGAVILANRVALERLDLTRDQLDALHLHDLPQRFVLPEREDWRDAVYQAMRDGSHSVLCRPSEGGIWQVALQVVEVGHRPGTGLLVVLEDVTEATATRRVRDEVLEYMSHDMRSPLISVLALLEKARLSSGESPAWKNLADTVEQHIRRNLAVSEQLLQIARLESAPKVEMMALDMLSVAESALEQVGGLARERDVRIRFHYDDRVPVWVMGNQELLEKLLVSLLSNAVGHSYSGNSVELTLDACDDRVTCEVKDRGAGVAPELLARVFESPGEPGRVRGPGYGLRFVRLVTERHDGEIQASGQPGEGSRFVLSLPRLSPDGLDATV